MEELLNKLLTTGLGIAILGGSYFLDLIIGSIKVWFTEDAKWSIKKAGEDFLKALILALGIECWVALWEVLSWYCTECSVDIASLAEGFSTSGMIAAIIGGSIWYLKNAYTNAVEFINTNHIQVSVDKVEYDEIANKVYELFETPKEAVEAQKEAEANVAESGMGQYYSVPYDTYDNFRNAVNGNGYDLDGLYSYQCLTAGHLVSMADGTYKPVEELEIGDEVYGGNKVVSNESQLANLYKVKTSMGAFTVSAGHRFILEDGSECKVENSIDEYIKLDTTEPEEKFSLTNDELRFLGFYLGDGTKKYRWQNTTKPEIFVTAGTELKCDYLKNLAVGLKENTHSNGRAKTFTLKNAEHEALCDFIHNMNGKELPRVFTKEQYALIIDGYMHADGYVKGSSCVITSVCKELLASIQFGCILNNWRAKLSEPLYRESTNYCENPKPLYKLTINKNHPAKAHIYEVKKIDDGIVYVLNLDGNHLYFADNHCHHNCWDGACLLWQQLGRWLSTGGTGAARGCWTHAKDANAGNDFDLITDKTQIKRGDVVVFSCGTYGHIGYADEDYNGGTYIKLLGQNQSSDMKFCVINMSLNSFLGAFRYKQWKVEETKEETKEEAKTEEPVGKTDTSESVETKTEETSFKVGDIVKPTQLVDYYGTPLKQYDDTYTISQLNGDRAVLTAPRNGKQVVWCAININSIKKA